MINLFELPSIAFTKRPKLPPCPALYFVLAEEKLLYVGRTANLLQRWNMHHRRSDFVKHNADRIAWLECSDLSELEMEDDLIATLEPALNGKGGRQRTELKRLATFVPEFVSQEMEKWAAKEKRSLSNLAAYLLENAVRDYQQQQAKVNEAKSSEAKSEVKNDET